MALGKSSKVSWQNIGNASLVNDAWGDEASSAKVAEPFR
jgi:hypothetical protein